MSDTLDLYDLPTIRQLLESTPTKLEWKRQTRQALPSYWTTSLLEEAQTKSTLSNCFLGNLGIGNTHMVWDSIQPNLQDVKRGHVKARLLTGTYMLQSTRYIDVKDPIGSKLLFLGPIRPRKGAYPLKTIILRDSDIKR